MIAVVDSGNSRIHYTVYDFLDTVEFGKMTSIPYPGSLDSLRTVFTGLYDYTDEIEKVAACSVNARWREELFKTLHEMFPGKLVVARTAADAQVKVAYDNPAQYGVDRALAAYAGHRYFGDSCVIVDAGTAVTVDAVGDEGSVIGGYIFPGKSVVAEALSAETGLLIQKGMNGDEGIGTSTESCIEYGISMGFGAAVGRLVEMAAAHAGGKPQIMLTGGNAGDIVGVLPYPAVLKPGLVLEALGILADMLPKY